MKAAFSEDVSEFLLALAKHDVRYMIVGGEAVIYYGHARLTGVSDIFYERTPESVSRLYSALNEFWLNDIPGIESEDELMQKGTIFQFGVPPNRIDLINDIEGVAFKEAWKNHVEVNFPGRVRKMKICYIGLDELIKNKRAVGRHKDMEDLEFLEKARTKSRKKRS